MSIKRRAVWLKFSKEAFAKNILRKILVASREGTVVHVRSALSGAPIVIRYGSKKRTNVLRLLFFKDML